jgi:hypothetical protein
VLARLAGKGSLSELLEGYTEALEGKEIRLAHISELPTGIFTRNSPEASDLGYMGNCDG